MSQFTYAYTDLHAVVSKYRKHRMHDPMNVTSLCIVCMHLTT